MTTFHAEARALYQVLALEPYLADLPENIRKDASIAIQAAEARFEALMREHRGYWKGDLVMHGQRGPFLVDSFTLKHGLQNPAVVLRRLNANGKPSKLQVWEYLDTKLTLVTK